MSEKKSNKSQSSVMWWINWILLTIASFFLACFFWTWAIAKHVGSVKNEGVTVLWVIAVFGTWMVLLLPLIVMMYWKVDKAYEDARIRREALALKRAEEARLQGGFPFRVQFVEESKRLLKEDLRKKIGKWPEVIKGGKLVTALLKDGRRVENVFVAGGMEIVGVYGMEKLSFDMQDIEDLELQALDFLTPFAADQWLRLDIPAR